MSTITIAWPDDFYLCLGRTLHGVLDHTTAYFHRALLMPPRGKKPFQSIPILRRYRKRVLRNAQGRPFIPLLSFEVVPGTKARVVKSITGSRSSSRPLTGCIHPEPEAVNTIGDLTVFEEAFTAMEERGIVLCLQCELPNVLYPEREKEFLRAVQDIADNHPSLKILLQGARTLGVIGKVLALYSIRGNVAATITAPDIFAAISEGSLPSDPHQYKQQPGVEEENFNAIRGVITHGREPFFFGSQSTPRSWDPRKRESNVFVGPGGPRIVAQLFTEYGRGNIETDMTNFMSGFGSYFFGIPRNTGELVLEESGQRVPDRIGEFIPVAAGHELIWSPRKI